MISCEKEPTFPLEGCLLGGGVEGSTSPGTTQPQRPASSETKGDEAGCVLEGNAPSWVVSIYCSSHHFTHIPLVSGQVHTWQCTARGKVINNSSDKGEAFLLAKGIVDQFELNVPSSVGIINSFIVVKIL